MGSGPVLGRALQILGAFTAAHPAMTLSALARHAGLRSRRRTGWSAS